MSRDRQASAGRGAAFWFAVGMALVLVAGALGAVTLTSAPQIGSGATFNASAGPAVTVAEDTQANLTVVFPDSSTVALGNATVTGPNGSTTDLTGLGIGETSTLLEPDTGIQLNRDDAVFGVAADNGTIDELGLVSNATLTADGANVPVVTGAGDPAINITGVADGTELTVLDSGGSQVAQGTVSDGSLTVSLESNTSATLTVLDEAGTLSGIVTDVEGTRIEGATVNATLDGSTTTTTTNASGYYALNLDAAGEYTVTADAGALGNATETVGVVGDAEQNITVAIGDKPPALGPGEIALQLLDAPAGDESFTSNPPGNPVPDATLRVKDAGVEVDSATTDGDGWAVLDVGSASEYELEIEVGGEVMRTTTRTLNPGDTLQTGVAFDAPVLLEGSAEPAGVEVSEQPGDDVTLSIDATSDAFPSDAVTVEFYRFDTGDPTQDELVDSVTLSSSDTATGSFTIDGSGTQEWYAVATDRWAYTADTITNAFAFQPAFGEPTVSNLDPDGATQSVGEEVTLSATVGHDNIDETGLTVSFLVAETGDPTQDPIIGQTSTSDGGTVSTTWTLPGESGPHEWYVAVEDDAGQLVTSDVATIEYEAEFDVQIISAPGAITGGDSFDVEFLVQNVGGESGTDTVTIRWNGSVVDERSYTLDPIIFDEDQEEYIIDTVTISTSEVESSQDRDIEIETVADEANATVTVAPPAEALLISGFDPPSIAPPGGDLSVDVTVENVGTETIQNSPVELQADESGDGSFSTVDSTSVTVDGGNETTVTLTYTVPNSEGETVDIRATTLADTASSTITISSGDLNINITNEFPDDGATIDVETLLSEPLSAAIDVPADRGDIIVRLFDETGDESRRLESSPAVVSDDANTSIATTRTMFGAGFDVGTSEWRVEAEDSFGRVAAETFSFDVQASFDIREETAPGQPVTDDVEVTVRELVDDQPVIFEETVSDGSFNISGVSADAGILIDMRASNYTDRSVVFPSVPVQENLYLLDDSITQTAVAATLDGGTTDPADADLQIQRALPVGGNSELTYETIAGDQFGSGSPVFNLETGERYRALLVDRNEGTTQNMGTFVATGEEQTLTIDPGVPPIQAPDAPDPWQVRGEVFEETVEIDGEELARQFVAVRFDDPEDRTTLVEFTIFERGNENNTLVEEVLVTPRTYSNEYEIAPENFDTEWVLEYEVVRNGERTTGREVLTLREDGVPDPLDTTTATIVGIGLMLLVGGLFSVLSVGVGAVVTSLTGGMLWWLGWLGAATTGAAVVIALAVSVVYYMARRGPR